MQAKFHTQGYHLEVAAEEHLRQKARARWLGHLGFAISSGASSGVCVTEGAP